MLITDYHIHSRFARATSKKINPVELYRWAKLKGINVLGTGDFTHPDWFKELDDYLEEYQDTGLYVLKNSFKQQIDKELPNSVKQNPMFFVYSVEISNIYKRHDKVRKLHNLIVTPNKTIAAKISLELSKIGNIKSDGRPILGLDSKDLLQIVLNIDEKSLFIPAHIWTPWFSMFGSRSGFDSIEEAFGDLSSAIKAVETGLSSDPYMNWRLKSLQKRTLVSNSDAHSLLKLGREANLQDVSLNVYDLFNSIKTNDKSFVGTIEFYPQEGRYFADGHRACSVVLNPDESKRINNICPKCKKPLVLGVNHRVSDLADYPLDFKYKTDKKVEYIVPLMEIIAQVYKVKSINSKKVQKMYFDLIDRFGNEFFILRDLNISDLEKYNPVLAKAILNMRNKNIKIKPGYDGLYGTIQVVLDETDNQSCLF